MARAADEHQRAFRDADGSPVERARTIAGGHRDDRAVRGDLRGRRLGGDRDVRADEGGVAADVPGAAGRDPVARHVRARVPAAGPGGVPAVLPGWVRAVVGERGTRRTRRAGGGDRRQDAAAVARSARGQGGAAPGQRLGDRDGLVVGQVATDAKSNEITAIPDLLRLLDLEGATVTIDAMGCQTAIAAQIVEQGADYVLALKDNHEQLHERVRLAFADADAAAGTTLPLGDLAAHTTIEKGHGRIEQRRCRAIGDPGLSRLHRPGPRLAAPPQRRLHRVHPPDRRRRLDRGPPLPLQPAGRRRAPPARHPQPLGHREPPPLGARRRFRR